ncbi:MAG: amyA [Pedosphaera sp.]|nr:amyA [Pedosphaera sp.]
MGHPILYEINTRCWLNKLSGVAGGTITLANVPEQEFARWEELGFTHIWLMGVWTTASRSRAKALQDSQLREVYNRVLPGWKEADVPGSPYAIGEYQVPAALGGEAGLAIFRERLRARGLRLLLDFVPNHVGLDHPWVSQRPELFVQSPAEREGTFHQTTTAGERWLAHGKDPYFAPWTDTVQVDYRRAGTRLAMIELLQGIAQRCDGVRCDMAMLLLNDVFAKTWSSFPTPASTPNSEFWAEAISAVKQGQRDFIFLAEAYWGLQPKLQALGFDYTYDKFIYDRLLDRHYGDLQRHLLEATPEYVARSAHFLENHDERRIASLLSLEEHRAAAMMILGLPGMRFLYEGQLTGARIHVPVQLGRCIVEPVDKNIEVLYERLLGAIKESAIGTGEGKILCPERAWEGNPTAQNIIVVQWQKSAMEFELVVVNLAPHRGQCRVRLAIEGLAARNWEMRDRLGHEVHQRSGEELQKQGLYLDLAENGVQLFLCRPLGNN